VLRCPTLPCAGRTAGVNLEVDYFVTSVTLLAWVGPGGCCSPRYRVTLETRVRSSAVCWMTWRLISAMPYTRAKAKGCPWNNSHGVTQRYNTCALAAKGGHLAVLVWARAHGCPWRAECICAWAANSGHLAVLRWAREHGGCAWDARTCGGAAAGGHLAVLQWARAHGCPWDTATCAAAAAGGHLETLRWAREHDCPWDGLTCARAAAGEHQEVLQWALAHGCQWDGSTYADMLAAQVVAAAAARAVKTLLFLLSIVASNLVALAVEAFDTWHTSSHSGIHFLLILLVRPLVFVLLHTITFYVVFVRLFSFWIILFASWQIPTFMALAPRQRYLLHLGLFSIDVLLGFVVVAFQMFRRVSIIALLHCLFAMFTPLLAAGVRALLR